MSAKTIALDDIRIDGNTQPRAGLNPVVVAEYATLYRDGKSLDRPMVYFDGSHYWLGDGFHRYHAARDAELSDLECVVRNGTQADAQWFSYSANQTHGLPRTNEDKRRAVELALKHSKGASLSDRQLGEHVGVSGPFVGKVREGISATANGLQSATRTGRDGRTINTANIGRKAAPEGASNMEQESPVDASRQHKSLPDRVTKNIKLARLRDLLAMADELCRKLAKPAVSVSIHDVKLDAKKLRDSIAAITE